MKAFALTLTKIELSSKVNFCIYARLIEVGTWRSLVAHYAGGVGVAGSNPVVPTILLSV